MHDDVGCRAVAVFDAARQLQVPTWLLYPTDAAPSAVSFGPYALDVALDAPITGDGHPLVVISHGNGGTPWAHRTLALHLVRRGFVVVVLEHPGSNRRDNSLSDPTGVPRLANLENRPRHVRLVIDAAFGDPDVGPRLAAAGVAIIGHSLGAYTALALAGGHAMTLPDDVEPARRLNPDPETRRRAVRVVTERDPRVRATVLLGPAIFWFVADDALAEVAIPMLVRTGELDPVCPPAQVAAVLRSVPNPTRVDHVIVPNAGHFSFQSPFPPALTGPAFAPSQDPPGFDRARYQAVLQDEIVAFVRRAITTTHVS